MNVRNPNNIVPLFSDMSQDTEHEPLQDDGFTVLHVTVPDTTVAALQSAGVWEGKSAEACARDLLIASFGGAA